MDWLGGLIGLLLGVGFSKSVELGAAAYFGTNLIQASLSPFLLLGSLVFSVVIGVIAGTLPAVQASRLKPVEALRRE